MSKKPKKTEKTKKTKHEPLSPQQRQLLDLAKNGIVTVDIFHRCFFSHGTAEGARTALRRMVELRFLKSEPLDSQRVYYRLTPRGARLIDEDRKYAQPLKRQAKIERYAVTWFIHAEIPGQRALLKPTDYPEQFPVAGHRLPRRSFFLDRSDGRSRLGIIFVDHNAHHRRMSQKTVAVLRRFLRHGWFDTFIRQDAFALTILTFSPYRKQTFEQHVPRSIADQLGYPLSQLRPDLARAVPSFVHVHVVPELEAIITHSQKENPRR